MSFWDSVKKIKGPFADVEYDDEDYDEFYEEEEAPRHTGRRVAEPEKDFAPAATTAAPAKNEGSGFSGKVLNMNSNKPSVVLFRPTSFNDASKAADDLRDKRAVIVNMENVDRDVARRVVDFLSGCAYALDGKVKKIAQSTYLFCPNSMDVAGDLEAVQAEAEVRT